MVTSYDSRTGYGAEPSSGYGQVRAYNDTYARSQPGYDSDGRQAFKKAKDPSINYSRLFQAMRTSRRVLEVYRSERLMAIRQYVGRHYAEGGLDLKVPVNLIARYVQIISRSLVPNCPRVMLSTQKRDKQPAVSAMQEWVNQRLKAMKFANSLRRWVVDALFSIGIMKVALGTPADSAQLGYATPAGVPFATTVDLDDFVFDIGCRDMSEASYVGHRYRVPLEVAQSLDYFDKKARKKLDGSLSPNDYRINQEGDDRVGVIGQGWQGGEARDFEPMVDLWEIYIPRLKKVCTFASDSGGVPADDCEPLRVQEWLGPDCGPYHFLSLMPVPGNPMPKSPVHDLIDLHEFVNHGYRKLVNQMQRQKEVLPVRGGQVDDAKQLIQANDGEAFGCDNADNIKPISYGGPNQINANFTVHLTDVFNKMAGNLDLLAGSSPQSKTATQDKLLAENASAGVSDMQDTTTNGTAGVLEAMCWYWWYHPQEVMRTQKTLPGLSDIGIERQLFPASYEPPPGQQVMKRDGRFEDLDVRVDPYSMVYRSPQQRLQMLMMTFEKFVPIMPMLQQQGIQMDVQFLVKKIAEYADEPDIIGLFSVSEPTQQMSGPQEPPSGKPAETTRNYTRQSIGQDTEASRYADMQNDATAMASEIQE